MGTNGTDIQSAIMAQVKAEMAAMGWKVSDLAEAASIPTSSLYRYLAGERDVTLPIYVNMADGLKIPYTELVARAQRRLEGKEVQ